MNSMDSLFPGRSSIPRRRSAAAALAAALFASVLVVAPVAVGAANTADETLVDHDGKAGTPKVRQFAGSSRYATALAAARQFVADVESGNNFVDTAIVVSGENLVDAAAVAGLARSLGAPVLLTPAGSLLPALATFLADEFIADVIVVGGTAAVSESVVDALAKVPSVESVVRLSGRDRYATSAAVADETGAEGEYCSTGRRGAVLVNVDSTFSDALAAGPLAYASELPVLLTRADALPTDVGGFLVDEAVEQVVIVGGTAAVSAAVAAEVAEAGVSKVTRIEGANRYATSVAVAAEIARCGSVVFNANSIALANDASPAAGLVAAPMLGRGLRDAGVTPLLLVGDALPADVAAYLSSTPTRTSTGAYTDLALTAIGGTGAVSESVMEAAVAAATTSDLLSVTGVKVSPSGTSVAVTFSDQLDNRAGEATYGANRARYRIDGSALFKDDTVALAADRRSVTLTLIDVLKPGSVITVADDKIAGFGNDGRLVAGFSYTVPKRTVDRIRPRIRILASDNASQFTVFVDETNLKTPTG
ncbi:MAG TPA: hypothetical protein DEP66_01960, partial [Acidimicrobiaceae bacterium]|nr:hypothetical protein [Acidimicrobiaceae bacterium]